MSPGERHRADQCGGCSSPGEDGASDLLWLLTCDVFYAREPPRQTINI